ncbi:NUDIX hydrolase [Aliikangiella maris]|uniref:NUDIX domain-containing protein n=2 Tax=Aliikangiella maris TaxID=3162458 RepID=A0ABV3MM14_9GAMM
MSNQNKEKNYLKNYRIHDYEVPLTCVDVVIFTIVDNAVNVLLSNRKHYPCKGAWAIPGGFIDLKKDHDLQQTAYRILFEKTGYQAPYLEQIGSFGNAQRDPRGWSVTITYFALVNVENVTFAADCQWYPINETGEVNKSLAFDHNELISEAFQRLRSKAQYSTIILPVLPEKFTLSELQTCYETILGGKLNKAGFRRRILKAEVITELSGEYKQTSTRTAQLYKRSDSDNVYFYMREIYAK